MKILMAVTLIIALTLDAIYMKWVRKTGDTSWRHALQHAVAEIRSIFK